MTNKPIHNRDLVNNPLLLESVPPEMRVLFREWMSEDTSRINLSKQDYLPNFNKWYAERESLSKAWAEYSESLVDKIRLSDLNPLIAKKVKSISGKSSILEIGCGTGEAVIPFLKPEQTYVGVDPSIYCLSGVKERYGIPNISLGNENRNGSFTCLGALPAALPFPNKNIFDEVICNLVLQNVKDLNISLSSIHSLLKPRGNFFISIFDADKVSAEDFPEINGNKKATYHSTSEVYHSLRNYCNQVKVKPIGGIFKVFEGRVQ